MRFCVPFSAVDSGAVADTPKTIAAVQAGDTAGYRCRLRALAIGLSEDTPVDESIEVSVKRVDDVSAGGAGTKTAVTPTPMDSLSRAAVCSAGKNYTAEPTTYGEALFEVELNGRNSLVKEWSPEDAPVCNRDQLVGLLVAPRTANAREVTGSLEFEEF